MLTSGLPNTLAPVMYTTEVWGIGAGFGGTSIPIMSLKAEADSH